MLYGGTGVFFHLKLLMFNSLIKIIWYFSFLFDILTNICFEFRNLQLTNDSSFEPNITCLYASYKGETIRRTTPINNKQYSLSS